MSRHLNLLLHGSFCSESRRRKSCVFSVVGTLTSLSFIQSTQWYVSETLGTGNPLALGQIKPTITHHHVLFQYVVDSVASGFSWNESREWVYLKTSLQTASADVFIITDIPVSSGNVWSFMALLSSVMKPILWELFQMSILHSRNKGHCFSVTSVKLALH